MGSVVAAIVGLAMAVLFGTAIKFVVFSDGCKADRETVVRAMMKPVTSQAECTPLAHAAIAGESITCAHGYVEAQSVGDHLVLFCRCTSDGGAP